MRTTCFSLSRMVIASPLMLALACGTIREERTVTEGLPSTRLEKRAVTLNRVVARLVRPRTDSLDLVVSRPRECAVREIATFPRSAEVTRISTERRGETFAIAGGLALLGGALLVGSFMPPPEPKYPGEPPPSGDGTIPLATGGVLLGGAGIVAAFELYRRRDSHEPLEPRVQVNERKFACADAPKSNAHVVLRGPRLPVEGRTDNLGRLAIPLPALRGAAPTLRDLKAVLDGDVIPVEVDDEAFWSVAGQDSEADLDAYISAYPKGAHAAQARAAKGILVAEKAISLARDDKVDDARAVIEEARTFGADVSLAEAEVARAPTTLKRKQEGRRRLAKATALANRGRLEEAMGEVTIAEQLGVPRSPLFEEAYAAAMVRMQRNIEAARARLIALCAPKANVWTGLIVRSYIYAMMSTNTLSIEDRGGRDRAYLHVEPSGRAFFMFADSAGRYRQRAAAFEIHPSPGDFVLSWEFLDNRTLLFRDDGGQPRAVFCGSRLVLLDADGKISKRIAMNVDKRPLIVGPAQIQ